MIFHIFVVCVFSFQIQGFVKRNAFGGIGCIVKMCTHGVVCVSCYASKWSTACDLPLLFSLFLSVSLSFLT